MSQHYDVAIVGSGPAGSTTARVVAENGAKTVLIDRRRIVGVPVQCGELIPTPREVRNLFPSSTRMPKSVSVPKKFILNRTSAIRLVSPNGKTFEFPFEANIIDRALFDQHLAKKAEDAGVDVLLNTKLLNRTRANSLVLESERRQNEIQANIVVGADGSRSKIAQSLGPQFIHNESDLSPSLQYVMENSDADSTVVEMYFGSVAPGGYAWIIPKGDDMVNVGFGMRRSIAKDDTPLRDYIDRFVYRNPLVTSLLKRARIVSRVSAIIPVGGPLKRTWSSDALLVGDAAGHVMASNGGGIPTALCGGIIAGEAISSHLETGSSLSLYEETWRVEFGIELETALRVLRVADTVMPSDSITDICMRLAGVRFLEPLIRCRLPPLVDFTSKTLVRVLGKVL